MLKNLIFSIFENKTDKLLISEVNIIVVDNDKDRTAEAVINEIKVGNDTAYRLFYFNHPVKGLSNVRNELLKQALLKNPDFIIFIDDDEFVTPYWLIELLKSIINNNSDAARGPVLAKLDDSIPEYISCFFEREKYPDNARIFSFTTGNLILRRKSLEKYNVWFDKRFNFTGSEDSFFGTQMMKKGATIYWAAKAIAYETIPESRATVKWLIKRKFSHALMYTYMLKLKKEYLKLTKKFLVSLLYIFAGICAMSFLLIPIKKKYWGILKFFEGMGGLAGLFKVRYEEYN